MAEARNCKAKHPKILHGKRWQLIRTYKYRVSINSFPDYKHSLQENYVEYKEELMLKCTNVLGKKLLELSYIKKNYFSIPRSFLVINVCNQGKNLCSPCICTRVYQ